MLEQILSELSVDNIRSHVKHIVETMPSRLAGTPNAARMAAYSAEQMRAAGVTARIETIPGLVSFPREAELTILSPEEKVLPANTFGHSLEIRTACRATSSMSARDIFPTTTARM